MESRRSDQDDNYKRRRRSRSKERRKHKKKRKHKRSRSPYDDDYDDNYYNDRRRDRSKERKHKREKKHHRHSRRSRSRSKSVEKNDNEMKIESVNTKVIDNQVKEKSKKKLFVKGLKRKKPKQNKNEEKIDSTMKEEDATMVVKNGIEISTAIDQPHMIEVILNDRLGKKVRVKCNSDDTIKTLKILAAAQLGTRPEKLQLKKWYNIFKDHIRLDDYEINDGMSLELYYN